MPQRSRGMRPRAKAVAVRHDLTWHLTLVVTLVFLAFACLVAFAKRSDGAEALERVDVRDLEVRVWTSDETALPAIERDVVRLLQMEPGSAAAHQLLSRIYLRVYAREPSDLYLLRQAADLAQQAIDLAPSQSLGYVAYADILDLMGSNDKALRLLDEAAARGVAADWRLPFARARLTEGTAAANATLDRLGTALGQPGAEPRIIAPYVIAILQAEATGEELVSKLKEWNTKYPSPVFELTIGTSLGELGRHSEAHALYERLVAAEPELIEAQVNDAIILYRHLGNPLRATQVFDEVLKKRGLDLAKSTTTTIEIHRGAAYLALKRWHDAEAAFERAAILNPEAPSVLDFIAKVYREAKAPTEFVALINRLSDAMPGTGVLHAILGETLSESLHQHDAALRAFSDAIVLDPGRSDYYNGMGLTYYRKQAYQEALRQFAAASDLDPNDATARYNEACMLSLLGRSEDALSTLAEALTLDPRLVATARVDGDFATIKLTPKFRNLVESGSPSTRGVAGSMPDLDPIGH